MSPKKSGFGIFIADAVDAAHNTVEYHQKPGTIMFKMRTLLERLTTFVFFVLLLAAAPLANAQKRPEAVKSLRLYIFDCGTLDMPDVGRYNFKREELATNLMSDACFLIVHPRGTLMWDTGVVPDKDFKSDGAPVKINYATATRPLLPQMAAVGCTMKRPSPTSRSAAASVTITSLTEILLQARRGSCGRRSATSCSPNRLPTARFPLTTRHFRLPDEDHEGR